MLLILPNMAFKAEWVQGVDQVYSELVADVLYLFHAVVEVTLYLYRVSSEVHRLA